MDAKEAYEEIIEICRSWDIQVYINACPLEIDGGKCGYIQITIDDNGNPTSFNFERYGYLFTDTKSALNFLYGFDSACALIAARERDAAEKGQLGRGKLLFQCVEDPAADPSEEIPY